MFPSLQVDNILIRTVKPGKRKPSDWKKEKAMQQESVPGNVRMTEK